MHMYVREICQEEKNKRSSEKSIRHEYWVIMKLESMGRRRKEWTIRSWTRSYSKREDPWTEKSFITSRYLGHL